MLLFYWQKMQKSAPVIYSTTPHHTFVKKITCESLSLLSFFKLLFYIGMESINNVVLVSGIQQSDSVIHVHLSILFKFFSHLHNTE